MTVLPAFTTSARFLAMSILAACASSPVSLPTPDRPIPQEPTVTMPLEPAGPVSFTYRDGKYVYQLDEITIITVGSDSTTATLDTLETSALLTHIVRNVSQVLHVTALIDSLSLRSTRDVTLSTRRLDTTLAFDFQLDSITPYQQAELDTTQLICDSMQEVGYALARNILARVPQAITPGSEWTDSTTSRLCRGGIPMTAQRRSVFRIHSVQDSAMQSLLRITRITDLTLSGSGAQDGRQITVTGRGRAETLLIYDVQAGVLLESQGQALLQLGFQTAQGIQYARQETRSRARLRPAAGDSLQSRQ